MAGDANTLVDHPTFRRLSHALATRPAILAPDDGAPRRAAVAIVLRRTADDVVELLLIKRSEREDDPWSGHVALPGGRHDPSDVTLQDTAIRETREETGIDVTRDGVVLGMLDELRPRTPTLPPIIVTPFVAIVRPDVTIETSDEVAVAFWVALASLEDPSLTVESEVSARGATWRVPSYLLGGHIVWGMTERILRNLQALVGNRESGIESRSCRLLLPDRLRVLMLVCPKKMFPVNQLPPGRSRARSPVLCPHRD